MIPPYIIIFPTHAPIQRSEKERLAMSLGFLRLSKVAPPYSQQIFERIWDCQMTYTILEFSLKIWTALNKNSLTANNQSFYSLHQKFSIMKYVNLLENKIYKCRMKWLLLSVTITNYWYNRITTTDMTTLPPSSLPMSFKPFLFYLHSISLLHLHHRISDFPLRNLV